MISCLALAWKCGARHIILASNSLFLFAISFVRGGVSNVHPLSQLIFKVKELLNRDWIVNIHHAFKEGYRTGC